MEHPTPRKGAGWGTNSTWAIADGAGTNYFFMQVEASTVNDGDPPPAAM